ncbi:MAG: hypothetical protein K6B28_09090 [Lachnospiraceae bacterium]|nr:hypothetical protein [Lachnospiraceae bacterium]
MKKRILGIVLCAAMVMSNSSVVFAEICNEDKSYAIDSEVTDGIEASNGAEVTVNKVNVSNESGDAISASGEGTKVTVNNGNITTGESNTYEAGIRAVTGAKVDVTGDVKSNGNEGYGINARYEGTTVTVTGNVSSESGEGINAGDGATVSVTGNVSGGKGKAAVVAEESTVNVTGDVSGTVSECGNSKITIDGDVTASEGKSAITTDGDSTIVITGTVTVSGDDSAIEFNRYTDLNENASASEIVVYEIAGNTDNLVKTTLDATEDSTKKEEQIQNIFYIIKTADGSSGNISSVAGTTEKAGYDTATQDTVLTVTVKKGYGVSAGTIKVTKNDDGTTYTLTVPAGGGVTLTAEQLEQAVEKADEYGTATVDTDTSTDDNANTPTEDNANAAVDPVNNASAEQTANNTSNSESSDNSSSNNQDPVWQPDPVQNLNPVNPSANVDPISMGEAGYEAKIVGMVANVAPGGKLELNITDAAYLSTMIVEALSIRNDVSLSLVVNYMGIPYTIDIPAGFDLKSLLGPDGKIDFAKLLATFGAKVK